MSWSRILDKRAVEEWNKYIETQTLLTSRLFNNKKKDRVA